MDEATWTVETIKNAIMWSKVWETKCKSLSEILTLIDNQSMSINELLWKVEEKLIEIVWPLNELTPDTPDPAILKNDSDLLTKAEGINLYLSSIFHLCEKLWRLAERL